jgi:hypothetical protein
MAHEHPAGRNARCGKFRRAGGDHDGINAAGADANADANADVAERRARRRYDINISQHFLAVNEQYDIIFVVR